MRGCEFPNVASDLAGFSSLFTKCVARALGLPSACVEVVNVTHGSVVVEFVLRRSPVGSDERTASNLLALLERQLANPISAIRKGLLAVHLANTELLTAEPRPHAAAARSCVANSAKH